MTADGIMRLFREIAQRGCAVVMSTHNTTLIEQYPRPRPCFSPRGGSGELNLKEQLAGL